MSKITGAEAAVRRLNELIRHGEYWKLLRLNIDRENGKVWIEKRWDGDYKKEAITELDIGRVLHLKDAEKIRNIVSQAEVLCEKWERGK